MYVGPDVEISRDLSTLLASTRDVRDAAAGKGMHDKRIHILGTRARSCEPEPGPSDQPTTATQKAIIRASKAFTAA